MHALKCDGNWELIHIAEPDALKEQAAYRTHGSNTSALFCGSRARHASKAAVAVEIQIRIVCIRTDAHI